MMFSANLPASLPGRVDAVACPLSPAVFGGINALLVYAVQRLSVDAIDLAASLTFSFRAFRSSAPHAGLAAGEPEIHHRRARKRAICPPGCQIAALKLGEGSAVRQHWKKPRLRGQKSVTICCSMAQIFNVCGQGSCTPRPRTGLLPFLGAEQKIAVVGADRGFGHVLVHEANASFSPRASFAERISFSSASCSASRAFRCRRGSGRKSLKMQRMRPAATSG